MELDYRFIGFSCNGLSDYRQTKVLGTQKEKIIYLWVLTGEKLVPGLDLFDFKTSRKVKFVASVIPWAF